MLLQQLRAKISQGWRGKRGERIKIEECKEGGGGGDETRRHPLGAARGKGRVHGQRRVYTAIPLGAGQDVAERT